MAKISQVSLPREEKENLIIEGRKCLVSLN